MGVVWRAHVRHVVIKNDRASRMGIQQVVQQCRGVVVCFHHWRHHALYVGGGEVYRVSGLSHSYVGSYFENTTMEFIKVLRNGP